MAIVAPVQLAATLRPGDVLLVEGNTRLSVAIKYLTQSTWSHAALFVGAAVGKVSIENTVKALLPFYGVLFLVLIAVTYIPALSLWLPGLVL